VQKVFFHSIAPLVTDLRQFYTQPEDGAVAGCFDVHAYVHSREPEAQIFARALSQTVAFRELLQETMGLATGPGTTSAITACRRHSCRSAGKGRHRPSHGFIPVCAALQLRQLPPRPARGQASLYRGQGGRGGAPPLELQLSFAPEGPEAEESNGVAAASSRTHVATWQRATGLARGKGIEFQGQSAAAPCSSCVDAFVTAVKSQAQLVSESGQGRSCSWAPKLLSAVATSEASARLPKQQREMLEHFLEGCAAGARGCTSAPRSASAAAVVKQPVLYPCLRHDAMGSGASGGLADSYKRYLYASAARRAEEMLREEWLARIMRDGCSLEDAPTDLRGDRNFVLEAVHRTRASWLGKLASKSLQVDKGFLSECSRLAGSGLIFTYYSSPTCFPNMRQAMAESSFARPTHDARKRFLVCVAACVAWALQAPPGPNFSVPGLGSTAQDIISMTFKFGKEVERSSKFPRHGLADAFRWAVDVTQTDATALGLGCGSCGYPPKPAELRKILRLASELEDKMQLLASGVVEVQLMLSKNQDGLGFQEKVQLKIIERWLRRGLGEDIEGMKRRLQHETEMLQFFRKELVEEMSVRFQTSGASIPGGQAYDQVSKNMRRESGDKGISTVWFGDELVWGHTADLGDWVHPNHDCGRDKVPVPNLSEQDEKWRSMVESRTKICYPEVGQSYVCWCCRWLCLVRERQQEGKVMCCAVSNIFKPDWVTLYGAASSEVSDATADELGLPRESFRSGKPDGWGESEILIAGHAFQRKAPIHPRSMCNVLPSCFARGREMEAVTQRLGELESDRELLAEFEEVEAVEMPVLNMLNRCLKTPRHPCLVAIDLLRRAFMCLQAVQTEDLQREGVRHAGAEGGCKRVRFSRTATSISVAPSEESFPEHLSPLRGGRRPRRSATLASLSVSPSLSLSVSPSRSFGTRSPLAISPERTSERSRKQGRNSDPNVLSSTSHLSPTRPRVEAGEPSPLVAELRRRFGPLGIRIAGRSAV
ncbi:DENND5A, partial [Symbiodinium microadriaticum]